MKAGTCLCGRIRFEYEGTTLELGGEEDDRT